MISVTAPWDRPSLTLCRSRDRPHARDWVRYVQLALGKESVKGAVNLREHKGSMTEPLVQFRIILYVRAIT